MKLAIKKRASRWLGVPHVWPAGERPAGLQYEDERPEAANVAALRPCDIPLAPPNIILFQVHILRGRQLALRPQHRMPRPYPPPPNSTPILQPFAISKQHQRDLAHTLRLRAMPPEVTGAIAHVIACYRATATGSRDTTVGNTREALHDLFKKGRAYKQAISRLADDHSGVDSITLSVMQPLAQAVLRGEPGAEEALAQAARERDQVLAQHMRVEPATEALRHFCGWLRVIFNTATHHLRSTITTDEAWHLCRAFAMEVFTIAEIDHADFAAHPERLTEYLGTEINHT